MVIFNESRKAKSYLQPLDKTKMIIRFDRYFFQLGTVYVWCKVTLKWQLTPELIKKFVFQVLLVLTQGLINTIKEFLFPVL
jgi:hypothetical protein